MSEPITFEVPQPPAKWKIVAVLNDSSAAVAWSSPTQEQMLLAGYVQVGELPACVSGECTQKGAEPLGWVVPSNQPGYWGPAAEDRETTLRRHPDAAHTVPVYLAPPPVDARVKELEAQLAERKGPFTSYAESRVRLADAGRVLRERTDECDRHIVRIAALERELAERTAALETVTRHRERAIEMSDAALARLAAAESRLRAWESLVTLCKQWRADHSKVSGSALCVAIDAVDVTSTHLAAEAPASLEPPLPWHAAFKPSPTGQESARAIFLGPPAPPAAPGDASELQRALEEARRQTDAALSQREAAWAERDTMKAELAARPVAVPPAVAQLLESIDWWISSKHGGPVENGGPEVGNWTQFDRDIVNKRIAIDAARPVRCVSGWLWLERGLLESAPITVHRHQVPNSVAATVCWHAPASKDPAQPTGHESEQHPIHAGGQRRY